MATSYALPLNGSGIHSHHGHGHTRSHHRKAVPERLPLAPTPINGALHTYGGDPQKELMNGINMAHAHSRSLPLETWGDAHQLNRQEVHAIAPRESRMATMAPNAEFRRSAAHIHAQKASYGFPDQSTTHGHGSPLRVIIGISR